MKIEGVNIDLVKDCENIAYNNLSKIWGEKKSFKLERDKVISYYFNAMMRIFIPKKPRKLLISESFNVVGEAKKGWEELKNKIIKGGDLMPHLSRGHTNPKNNDGLLNEWNVHHFHLGTEYESSGLVKRTKLVLLAVVKEDALYAIGIYDHKHWEDEEIIHIIDHNWPELQEDKVFHFKASDLTDKERRAVRKKGGNTLANLDNGRVLAGITTASGFQADALILKDRFTNRIIETEEEIKNPDVYNKIYEEIYQHLELKPKIPIKKISIMLQEFEVSSNSIIFYVSDLDFNIRLPYEASLAEYYMAFFNN